MSWNTAVYVIEMLEEANFSSKDAEAIAEEWEEAGYTTDQVMSFIDRRIYRLKDVPAKEKLQNKREQEDG